MTDAFLALLCCPIDGTRLNIGGQETHRDQIRSGILYCNKCWHWFPIVEGIPVIYRDEDRDPSEAILLQKYKGIIPLEIFDHGIPFGSCNDSVSRSSIIHYDYDPNAYDILLRSNHIDAVESRAYLELLRPRPSDTILELGSGTGRMTRHIAALCSNTVAMDHSIKMLRTLDKKMRDESWGSVYLLCGDATFLPFRPETFQKVCSFQVFEHLPEHLRRVAFAIIRTVLEAEGRFILSVYNWSLAKRLIGSKESYPQKEFGKRSDQYWTCFTKKELEAELSDYFGIETIEGVRNIPARSIADRLGFLGLGKTFQWVDAMISKTKIGYASGHLLLAECSNNHRGVMK